MPYRGELPPFSFAGIHTACICGDNGSGKSALIDAITWALWGKTRAKSDDELIHLGEKETEITFDFCLDSLLYRIIRKHSRPKKPSASGQSSLDLFLLGGDSPRVISCDTIGQTQQKIIDILRMDYDTFINSAFLRQGHAGEFTQQRPARRKEVLASILGLELYDRLEQQAKEQAKEHETERSQLDSALAEIESELCQQPSIEAALEDAGRELADIDKQTAAQQSRLNQLRRDMHSLENKKGELTRLDELMEKARQDLKRWQERHDRSLSLMDEATALIARRPVIEEGHTHFSQARQRCDELNHKLGLLIKLKETKGQLERAIDKAQGTLLADHAVSRSKIDQLTAGWQKLALLKGEQNELAAEWQQMADFEAALDEKRRAARGLELRLTRLESDRAGLHQDLAGLEEKLKLLSEQRDSRCPLCETELGGEELNLVAAKYTADKEQKTAALETSQAETAALKTEQQSLAREIAPLETELNRIKASLQGRDGVLKKAVAEAEAAGDSLAEEKKRLAAIEEKLAAKSFAAAEQEALSGVDVEIDGLGYDAEQHRKEKQQLEELEPFESQMRQLEAAERLLGQEEENAASAKEVITELTSRLATDADKRREIAGMLSGLEQVKLDLNRAETDYKQLADEQRQAQQSVGSLNEKLNRCRELKARKQESQKRLKQTADMESVYKELARAFGKKGIQAMLIETALPEIEVEANRLLGRMTDNRMHIRIETQRQSKKGETLETLDIKISDELGTRSYEMFSGGEAFRIDFAIRVALSRLLARRAGAPLPTLIIDEGFGTQDASGIERLKEAINSIQDDFEKILVITHMEELKDAFPTRIEVTKAAQGSTISVS
jgi:exonuclease SbcC